MELKTKNFTTVVVSMFEPKLRKRVKGLKERFRKGYQNN